MLLYTLNTAQSCFYDLIQWSMSSWRKLLAEIFAIAISVSGDARTGMREPKIGEIL